MTDSVPKDDTETANDDMSSGDLAQGSMMVVMAWREGDTESTIDDALRDGPEIVGEIAAEIAAERGLPRGWLKQLQHLAEMPPEDET